jgi:hypothetical protein
MLRCTCAAAGIAMHIATIDTAQRAAVLARFFETLAHALSLSTARECVESAEYAVAMIEGAKSRFRSAWPIRACLPEAGMTAGGTGIGQERRRKFLPHATVRRPSAVRHMICP